VSSDYEVHGQFRILRNEKSLYTDHIVDPNPGQRADTSSLRSNVHSYRGQPNTFVLNSPTKSILPHVSFYSSCFCTLWNRLHTFYKHILRESAYFIVLDINSDNGCITSLLLGLSRSTQHADTIRLCPSYFDK